jgi:hypothetical protein
MVQYAMSILLLHLSWTMRDLTLSLVQQDDAVLVTTEKRRDAVARTYELYAVTSETNAVEAVRREVSRLGQLCVQARALILVHHASGDMQPSPSAYALPTHHRTTSRCQSCARSQTPFARDG